MFSKSGMFLPLAEEIWVESVKKGGMWYTFGQLGLSKYLGSILFYYYFHLKL